MYEANPMAMLIEHAGGKALANASQRIMDVHPTDIHQRTAVILGSSTEVDHVVRHLVAGNV
jgi:fructose-1,6-bisphosphatase I